MIEVKKGGLLKTNTDVIKDFTITCEKCGGIARIDNDIGYGSDWTGMYGSIDIVCNNCNNRIEIFN